MKVTELYKIMVADPKTIVSSEIVSSEGTCDPVVGTVSGIDSNETELRITGIVEYIPFQYFVGGQIEFNNTYRSVVAQGPNGMTIKSPMPGLEVGDSIILYPACYYYYGPEAFYWTNSDEAIEYDGNTYVPEAISRTDMVQGNEINRQDIRLTIAPDNQLAQIFYKNPPETVTTVTIFRREESGGSSCFLTYWKGRVISTRSSDWDCAVECESVFTSMRRTGARARYQVQCRHALYGRACGVNKDDYAVLADVAAITNEKELRLSNIVEEIPGQYFVGGMVEFNGVYRFIVAQGSDGITMWRPMPNLRVTDTVTLYPGCNRTLAQCHERFNNADNHGGFPWLPYSNPFENVNIF